MIELFNTSLIGHEKLPTRPVVNESSIVRMKIVVFLSSNIVQALIVVVNILSL